METGKSFGEKRFLQQTPCCESNEMYSYNHCRYFRTGYNKELRCCLRFLLQHLSTQGLLRLSSLRVEPGEPLLLPLPKSPSSLLHVSCSGKGESFLVLCIHQIQFRNISRVPKDDSLLKIKKSGSNLEI